MRPTPRTRLRFSQLRQNVNAGAWNRRRSHREAPTSFESNESLLAIAPNLAVHYSTHWQYASNVAHRVVRTTRWRLCSDAVGGLELSRTRYRRRAGAERRTSVSIWAQRSPLHRWASVHAGRAPALGMGIDKPQLYGKPRAEGFTRDARLVAGDVRTRCQRHRTQLVAVPRLGTRRYFSLRCAKSYLPDRAPQGRSRTSGGPHARMC